jgi:uncharacterized protein (TIGR03435 family)
LTILAATPAVAQQTPSIDAATIKPNRSGNSGISNKFDPGRVRYMNVSLKVLIENLWQVHDYQVLNSPSWLSSDKWDLEMTTTSPTTMTQKMDLLRTLVTERFQLKLHAESRELPVSGWLRGRMAPNSAAPLKTVNQPACN